MEFRNFFIESEQNEVEKTLKKLPKKHAALVKGYSYKFQGGVTLKGDDGHIGEIDEKKKLITVAAPWNYGREYTLLHEIAHAVWKYLVDKHQKKEWMKLLKTVKNKSKQNKRYLDQNAEEIFCMIYAQFYCNNEMVKFDHPELTKFIDTLPQ